MNAMKWMIGCALIIGVGCQAATSSEDGKPTVDPDAELSGKADGLSNHYTTVRGELPLDDVVFGAIDYPDYFHGYTIDLEEGQTIQFTTWADAGGLVRVYGPGFETSRGLRYGRAAVRSHTSRRGERHQAEFQFDVTEAGTYMLVYGPDWVWSSDYELSTKCLAGCEVENECEDHGDCTDGWCRQNDWNADAGKACVPYVGEGESCGGFAPPQYVNACSPELTCVYRPFVADAPGACRNVATVADLEANPAQYEGMRVSIEGYINAGYAICTQMACTPDFPCCNSCGASQHLADSELAMDGLQLVGTDGGTYGCGGNNCTYADNCTVDTEGKVRVLGTLQTGRWGELNFIVEDIEPLEYL